MFEVISVSPIDEGWQQRDELMKKAAGNPTTSAADGSHREHVWRVRNFDRAVIVKNNLNRIAGVTASVREIISENGGKKGRK